MIILKRYNIIVVFDDDQKQVLMCLKTKKMFVGKYNFLGGEIEANETDIASAYRELFEEAGIKAEDICLDYIPNYQFHNPKYKLVLYAGILNKEVRLVEEVNPLTWMDFEENFFDNKKFAGNGDIVDMLNAVNDKLNIKYYSKK